MGPRKPRGSFLPWQEVMGLGLGVLRLPSPVFWAMTLRELEAAASGVLGPPSLWAALTRREFTGLMQAYPDSKPEENKNDRHGRRPDLAS